MGSDDVFNQFRVERCAQMHRAILENWQRGNNPPYQVQATESLSGLTLGELRLQYFAIAAGDVAIEIPFHDMLVVFQMIEQTTDAIRRLEPSTTAGTIQFRISTQFSDEEARRLLSRIRVETPHDPTPLLAVELLP